MACLVFAVFSFAQAEQFALGPANIYMDMIFFPEPYVDIGEPYAVFHDSWTGPINCTVYPAYIGHHREAQIQLHELAQPTIIDLSMIREVLFSSGLLPSGWSIKISNLSVDGHKGVLVNATSPDDWKVRVSGFCPQEGGDGKAKIICLVRSDLRWNCTRALLESMRVKVKL